MLNIEYHLYKRENNREKSNMNITILQRKKIKSALNLFDILVNNNNFTDWSTWTAVSAKYSVVASSCVSSIPPPSMLLIHAEDDWSFHIITKTFT